MIRFLVLSAVLVVPVFAGEWQTLFNGRDMAGWSGDPRLWRVENGVLTGETDEAARKIGNNTFLIWQGGEPGDFELTYKARVTGGNNSGVQYRSRIMDAKQWVVGGYQMDLHPDAPYLGMLYEEKGRGIACQRGQKVDLTDKPTVIGALERPEVKLTEWNDYRIVARGSLLQHYVNGKLAAEIRDNDPQRRSLKGVIALQLHAGAPMKAEFRELQLRLLEVSQDGRSAAGAKVAEPLPQWIWSSRTPKPNERVFFRRELDLKDVPKGASLTLTCDNWHRAWINGRDLGFAGDWSAPQGHDVTRDLKAGRNIIAVEGRNADGPAGMALRLRLTMPDGSTTFLVSDENWRCSREAAEHWQTAEVDSSSWPAAVALARMGDQPWGPVISSEGGDSSRAEDVTLHYQLAKDFRMERLYRVPKGYGSWVAMTVDDAGRLYCSDQYGKIYRVTPAQKKEEETQVEVTGIPLSGAHGLLWYQGVLYVSVNEGGKPGVYLVTDADRDGMPETPRLLKAFQGNGEHGPHGFAVSPDGEWIYLTAGNFTNLPEMDGSLPAHVWQEDQLLPRRPDARGHARDRMAPGGWIARFRPDGSRWELFAMGFRNAYDLAFDARGELFTYDSDMEWDLGTPWYRPTRICHVVPGAEFGWRNGSGVWPEYYEDSMFPQLDIGPGSPTGVLSGRGAKFPEKYQRAIYALDWTYATIHAIHLMPEGTGYRAEREEFLSGSGLPLTDAVIGKDGAMYVLTGGRKTDSALWRIHYGGKEAVAPVRYASKALERGDPAQAWQGLGSPDRLTRYESRLALEATGAESIATRLSGESDSWRTIGGALALARIGGKEHRSVVLTALDRLDWAKLDQAQRLNWLRAVGLAFARHGAPNAEERQRLLAKIDAAFPSNNETLDRELCRMLCYLEAPGIVGRTLALMDVSAPTVAPDWLAMAKRNANYGRVIEDMIAHLPPAQPIHYIYCLRVVKGPWSREERRRFFAWFGRLSQDRGGESYAGFIEDLRKEALATCTTEERAWIEKMEPSVARSPMKDLPRAKGPGRSWTIEEVAKLAATGLEGRDREKGRRMFQACLCATCHRFGGEGGSVGPDLTTSARRFTARDLAEAILEPSKVISDQYAFDLITRQDGAQVVGKILEEKDQHWIVATSPFDLSQTIEIERNQIRDMKPSPVSPMPAALINQLNPEELKDLLAYLLGK